MSRPPRPSASSPTSRAAILTFTGMLAFLSATSIYPRLHLTQDEEFTTLTYRHRTSISSGRSPDDPGMIISAGPKDDISGSNAGLRNDGASGSKDVRGKRSWSANDWILDTGATTHVCTDARRMHNYTSFENSALGKSVGHFGPNPVSIKGMGECTLELRVSESETRTESGSGSRAGSGSRSVSGYATIGRKVATSDALGIERGFTTRGRLTISNVSHIPTAGINIVSWSQLRRARGLDLRLRDNEDGSLGVVSVGRDRDGGHRTQTQLMRFVLRDGLYFLDKRDGE